MATKYDTNPLDPDFPEKVKAQAVGAQPAVVGAGDTSKFPTSAPTSVTEEETRRFNEAEFRDRQNVYNGQFLPVPYQPVSLADTQDDRSRKVEKLNLPENIVTAAPYIPWFIGLIAGLLILLLVPRSEAKVRFHAAQGLAAHVGILIVSSILGAVSNVTDFANIGSFIFTLVTSIMLVVFAIKAWQGKPVHIESVDDLTNWLEEKISPKLSDS